MIRLVIMALFLMTFAACGDAPPPTRSHAEPFTIMSEQPDFDNQSLTVSIKLAEPTTESSVRSLAESIIATRKDRYQSITVKSYLASASTVAPPYSISKMEGGPVTHQFNSQVAPQRIPTH